MKCKHGTADNDANSMHGNLLQCVQRNCVCKRTNWCLKRSKLQQKRQTTVCLSFSVLVENQRSTRLIFNCCATLFLNGCFVAVFSGSWSKVLFDSFRQSVHDFGVLLEIQLGVFSALSNLFAVVAKPRTALFN